MDGQLLVIKENETFVVSDGRGDVAAEAADGQGLYFQDTRFLSVLQFSVDEFPTAVLAAAGELSFMTTLQLANGPAMLPDGSALPARSISVRRNRFLHGGLHERIGFFNYNAFPVRATVRLRFGSDFRDMFDVRGYARRGKHGLIGVPRWDDQELVLPYSGLDQVARRTCVRFDRPPSRVDIDAAGVAAGGHARVLEGISGHGDPRLEIPIQPPTACAVFELELAPQLATSVAIHIQPIVGEPPRPGVDVRPAPTLDQAYDAIRDSYKQWDAECTEITTDHDRLNQLVRQSQGDLRLLIDWLPSGPLPTAGIPWFSVPFGRDSLITAYQSLMLAPAVAYGTLRFLAQHQGREVNDWRDEEPGKILHEIRRGELSLRGEVPFGPYYGSVDSTPLFLVLLGELMRWTADWQFAATLRPNVEAALEWIDRYGDLDGDGFVEYHSRSRDGIRNQGWKDSHDSISHRDGRAAEPPIALAEVQAYVYAAKQHAALLCASWGDTGRAERLHAEAEALRVRFEHDFWVESEGFYAIALDATKQQVPSVASNAGHVLWCGIAAPERAARVAKRLLGHDMACGWGVRTLSAQEPTFNPMSYHNGSVWPHDNALTAAGLRRYGFVAEALEVAHQVFDAGLRFPGYRLPELYCGFTRDRHYQSLPAEYPVSCRPQAWAATSVFLLLQQALGLEPDLAQRRLIIRPRLPPGVGLVQLRRLRVFGKPLDVSVRAHRDGVQVELHGEHTCEVQTPTGELAIAL